jgi:outer membrane lipopolysaccharide assembly protein LptE/RlpB
MKALLLLLTVSLLPACGGFNLFKEKKVSARTIASQEQSYSENVDEKLKSLYHYSLVGAKHPETYHQMAVRNQMNELEARLVNSSSTPVRLNILKAKIEAFGNSSDHAAKAMRGLTQRLNVNLKTDANPSLATTQKLIANVEASKEFLIYEKSIDHLSHMMKIKFRGDHRTSKISSIQKKKS